MMSSAKTDLAATEPANKMETGTRLLLKWTNNPLSPYTRSSFSYTMANNWHSFDGIAGKLPGYTIYKAIKLTNISSANKRTYASTAQSKYLKIRTQPLFALCATAAHG